MIVGARSGRYSNMEIDDIMYFTRALSASEIANMYSNTSCDFDSKSIAYRYAFNGMERDDEVKGSGNSYTTEFRQYDSRLGRWLTIDPVIHPHLSPYNAYDNSPMILIDPSGGDSEESMEGDPSTDVTKNEDGSYTVVGAYDDGDNNVYVVDDECNRTGEVIAKTQQPTDFLGADNETGGWIFNDNEQGQTFKLDGLTHDFTLEYTIKGLFTERTIKATRRNADGIELATWAHTLYAEKLFIEGGTGYDNAKHLKKYSANKKMMDLKESLGKHPYTPIIVDKTQEIPTITTIRAIGNYVFGYNLNYIRPVLWGKSDWYEMTMKEVGAYNQSQNSGNGYNPGFPFYGEHTYSGSYIYMGFFGEFPKSK